MDSEALQVKTVQGSDSSPMGYNMSLNTSKMMEENDLLARLKK